MYSRVIQLSSFPPCRLFQSIEQLPVLYSRSLLIIYFKYSSVYRSVSSSQCTILCLVCLMYLNVPLCSCDCQYFFLSITEWNSSFVNIPQSVWLLSCWRLNCFNLNCFHLGTLYWIGQKVHLGFSIRCYGKTSMTFLANPMH